MADGVRDAANEAHLAATMPGSRGQSQSQSNEPAVSVERALGRGDGFAKYGIAEELGRGGMGVVRAAKDQHLRRELAIKILPATTSSSALGKFIEEAQITGQLQHPNIVPVYELGTDPHGRPYMAMKRIHGQHFGEVIRRAHAQTAKSPGDSATVVRSLRRLLDVFVKICDAVAYAHVRGVIHRDLKPENVMVGNFGEVLVVDWGLAKPLASPDNDPDHNDHHDDDHAAADADAARFGEFHPVMTDRREAGEMTVQGAIQGTPAYMAPEQAQGSRGSVDQGADIYALGGILYTILTGQTPIAGTTTEDILIAVREHRLTPPSQRLGPRKSPAWVPRELEAVVLKAMARRRRDRYATAIDLRAEIDRYLDGRALEAADYTAWQLFAKWAGRNRAAVIGTAATVMALFVGTIAVLVVEQNRLQLEAQAVRQQQEYDLAEANRVAAEKLAAAEAARRADAEAVAQEREALLQKMRAGDYDHVLGLLESQVRDVRDVAIAEFQRLLAVARAAGKSDEQFIEELAAGKVDAYIAAFDRLFEQHEKRGIKVTAEDYFYRALLLHTGKRDFEGEIRDFDRAIAINPESATTYSNRGNSKDAMGDLAGAISDCNRALELDPEFTIAYVSHT